MRRIVITGATSMIGIALIKECIKHKIEVLAIIREYSDKIDLIPKSEYVTILKCELNNIKYLNFDIKTKYDTLYHLAWEKTYNLSRQDVSIHIENIAYTQDVVDLANRLGCKKFIGAGSQAEYGRKEYVINTNTECNPETAYGIAKYAAGKLSLIKCETLGIKHIWTRIFSVYGTNNNSETMIMYCIKQLLEGKKPILTKCEQLWDYLYCEDAAKALYLIGEKGLDKKIYNIASGVSKPLKEYVEQIRDLIDPNLELGIGELNYGNKQVMSLIADINDTTNDTGFIPIVSFEKGIKNTIIWTKNILNIIQ